jgi:hypothetical protein
VPITVLGLLLAWSTRVCGEEPPPEKELFLLSVPQLVKPDPPAESPQTPVQDTGAPTLTDPPSDPAPDPDPDPDGLAVAEMLRRSDWDFDQLPAWDQRLVRAAMESPVVPYRHPYEGGFLEKLDNTLFPEPAVVKVGSTYMTGGIVTAIKKKNPFGLINQTVFMLTF